MRIAVIDDEKYSRVELVHQIRQCVPDAEIMEAASGAQAAQLLEKEDFDYLFIDVRLGDMEGTTIASLARRLMPKAKIIFATAFSEYAIRAFELQVDDYILKPFDSKELVARVKAVLRRFQPAKPEAYASVNIKCVEYPGLIVNLSNYSVTYDGQQIDMPPKELELLYFLASSPNQVFTREQLLDNIWGYEYVGDTRTVDVHVKRLREKIKDKPTWRIATVWGIGYKFEVK